MGVYTYFIVGRLDPKTADEDMQPIVNQYPVVEYDFFSSKRNSLLLKLDGLYEPNEFTYKNFKTQKGTPLFFSYIAQQAHTEPSFEKKTMLRATN